MFVTDANGTKWVDDVKYVHMLFKDFQNLSNELLKYDITTSVGGDGFLKYLSSVELPVTAADIRAHEILKRLPEGHLRGAEIGVFAGDLSKRLLERTDLSLALVDSWSTQHDSSYGESGDFHASLTQEQQDFYYEITKNAVAFAGNRALLVRSDSVKAAELVEDESLDFVFIDGDHSYEGCKADLDAWWPKVKKGGLFSGHDYQNTDFPKFGVTQAVDEFSTKNNFKIEQGENFTWFHVK